MEEEHLDIINALGLVYQNLYSVNLKTSDVKVYRMSNQINSRYGDAFPNLKYETAIDLYVNKEVVAEDKDLFYPVATVERVKKILAERSEFSFNYRIERDEGIHYFQASFLRQSKKSHEFVAGFKDVNLIMKKQVEDQRRLNSLIEIQNTQISILGSLSGIYLTTHLIDLRKDICVEFNTSKEVREFVNQNENASLQMEKVMFGIMVPEQIEQALAFTNLRNLARRMKGKKIISQELIGKHNGWIRASFIAVESDENEVPYKVLFVTQVIDDEKRKEENLKNTALKDELTGLYNRHAYEEDLRQYKSKPLPEDFVYISFDVNGLKNINDSLGHEAGDELIIGAASCIKKSFGDFGKIYRSGGDEFQAMIFADTQMLKKLQENFEELMESWTGKLVSEVKIAAGYVQYSENPELPLSKISNLADERMYKSKALFYTANGIDRRGQQAAYEVLCHSYTKVLKVNLTTDKFSIIQMNAEEKDSVKGYNEKISQWLHDFGTSGQVHQDDTLDFLEKTNMDNLKKYFEAGNRIWSIHYRRRIDETFHKVMMEIIPSKNYTNENQEVYLYVKNIDA
ncbi:MAG: diguanylate cyclase [Treponema sp.]|nr:diguanylate cyclase [Candidatus Treponema equifaecale]